MIETKTHWEDSGYDCQFCGTKIYKRTDHVTGRTARACFQGEYGCQWSLDGKLIRIGSHPECQRLQRQQASPESPSMSIPVWAWGIVSIIFLFLIVRFGGFVSLRFLVPVALVGVTLVYVYRLGRERHWW